MGGKAMEEKKKTKRYKTNNKKESKRAKKENKKKSKFWKIAKKILFVIAIIVLILFRTIPVIYREYRLLMLHLLILARLSKY